MPQTHVPGMLKCPKCKFEKFFSTLSATTGAVGTDTSPRIEACPNDGELMKAVTWEEHARELGAALEREMRKARELEARANALTVFLFLGGAYGDDTWTQQEPPDADQLRLWEHGELYVFKIDSDLRVMEPDGDGGWTETHISKK